MTRKQIAPKEILARLGGSFCIVADATEDGVRHSELEGGNGSNVQIRAELGSGKVQAWLVVAR